MFNEGQEEYYAFWRKLAEKAAEARMDYQKLSPQNQERVSKEVESILRAGSIAEALNALSRRVH